MKWVSHGILCSVGIVVPPMVVHDVPTLIFCNMVLVIAACLTFKHCVLDD